MVRRNVLMVHYGSDDHSAAGSGSCRINPFQWTHYLIGFSFQPVSHDWYIKCHGMYCPVKGCPASPKRNKCSRFPLRL